MRERLTEIIHYGGKPAFPDGNSLCYKGEKDGHGQPPEPQETPLIEDGFIPNLFKEDYGTTKK